MLEEGSWSDAVDGALSKLNCKILDPKLLVPRKHEKVRHPLADCAVFIELALEAMQTLGCRLTNVIARVPFAWTCAT